MGAGALLVGVGEIVALDRSQLDLREATDIRRVVRESPQTMIFNAAAFTDVERARSDEAEALAINVPQSRRSRAHLAKPRARLFTTRRLRF